MSKEKDEFPKEFPFWARIKICKNRPTLVIDETEVINKKTKNSNQDLFIEKLLIQRKKIMRS